MKDNLAALRKASATFLILCVSCPCLFAQGQLPPPSGGPGPTMKSLDQIDTHVSQAGEKRIPIDAEHTPGDADSQFIIKRPGSYYLTGNLYGVAKKPCVLITANNVTVDLNGFTFDGAGVGSIGIYSSQHNSRILNGVITGWKAGIVVGSEGRLDSLIVSDNTEDGVAVGNNSLVDHCVIIRSGGRGLAARDHCRVEHSILNANFFGAGMGVGSIAQSCTANDNAAGGFGAAAGSTFVDCVANGNGHASGGLPGGGFAGPDANYDGQPNSVSFVRCIATANVGNGIQSVDGAKVEQCTAEQNSINGISVGAFATLSGCTAINNGTGTTGGGIVTGIRATITSCSAAGNKGDGIVFSGDSFVLNNHASKNGGAGLHDVGSASRIDGNVSRENTGTGILASTGDAVVRNNSGANGNLAANNQYGPTVGANWGPIGTANSATSPWANF